MIDGLGRLVHEIVLPHARDTVFDFFVDPHALVRWIGISADLDPRQDGRFRFEIEPGSFCEGTYTEVVRPGRVAFTWGWTDPAWKPGPGTSLVEVTLTEVPEGTHVRLVHSRLPPDARKSHDEGWPMFLQRLAEAAAGRDPGPYSTSRTQPATSVPGAGDASTAGEP